MKMHLKRQKGFTVIELMIVMATIAVVVIGGYLFLFRTVVTGNAWCKDDSVQRELVALHPEVQSVIKIERHVFDESVVTVKTTDGETAKWCLDSDILFNYEFKSCE